MTLKRLGVAFVGCGRISNKHAEFLTSGEVPEMRLAAACDIDPVKPYPINIIML